MTEIIPNGTGAEVRSNINNEFTTLEGTLEDVNIVKLVNGKLPAVDGSLLTNLPTGEATNVALVVHGASMGDWADYGNPPANCITQILYQNMRGICQTPDGNLYGALADYNRVIVSTNNGLNWINMSSTTNPSPWALLALPDSSILLGCTGGHIQYSTDNGNSFTRVSLISNFGLVRSLVISADNKIVAFGDHNSLISDYTVEEFIEYGANLDFTGSPFSITNDTIGSAVTLHNGNILVSTSAGNIFRSTDNGASFSSYSIPHSTYINGITQLNDGTILATNYSGNEIYASKDNGLTWDDGSIWAVPDHSTLQAILQLQDTSVITVDLSGAGSQLVQRLFTSSSTYPENPILNQLVLDTDLNKLRIFNGDGNGYTTLP